MARVRLVQEDEATVEQRETYAAVVGTRGKLGNLFRAMANSPELARRVAAVGAFLRYESCLPDRVREAVILAVAGRWDCAYERAEHGRIAAELGLPPDALDALARGTATEGLSQQEEAAVRYAQALAHDGRADEGLLEPIRSALGEAGLVELHVLVGYYSMLALFLNGLEVPVG